jgi:hypothetical protein
MVKIALKHQILCTAVDQFGLLNMHDFKNMHSCHAHHANYRKNEVEKIKLLNS